MNGLSYYLIQVYKWNKLVRTSFIWKAVYFRDVLSSAGE